MDVRLRVPGIDFEGRLVVIDCWIEITLQGICRTEAHVNFGPIGIDFESLLESLDCFVEFSLCPEKCGQLDGSLYDCEVMRPTNSTEQINCKRSTAKPFSEVCFK